MAEPAQDNVKTIVVPKALEDFFASRLSAHYAGRPDIRVVVDRRDSEPGEAPREEPRDEASVVERRARASWWSLPEMPFDISA